MLSEKNNIPMEISNTYNGSARLLTFFFLLSSFAVVGQRRIPKDPPIAPTMGFFLDDWQPKKFSVPEYEETPAPSSENVTLTANHTVTENKTVSSKQTEAANHTVPADYTVTVDVSKVITRIPPSEFGHNANTWMTPMVNQPVFLRHVNNLQPHIIRFPAGSGSDVYFWNRRTGDLPPDVPPLLTDKSGIKKAPGFFFGKPTSYFSASLDNYYEMLQRTGSSGLFTVNYGYARYGTGPNPVAAAAHLAADWVRYDHGRTRYWEIGNENNGNWE